MGKAQVAGYGIECADMGRTLILCKSYKALQRCCSDTNTCLTLNVK